MAPAQSPAIQRYRGVLSPAESLAKFFAAKPKLTPAFEASLNLPDMGYLPRKELVVNEIKRIVEGAVDPDYYPELINGPGGSDPHISLFTEEWRRQEGEHARVLDIVQQAATEPGNEIRLERFPYRRTWKLWYRLLGPVNTLALQMTWGAANETLTYAIYRQQAKRTVNATYRSLLEDAIIPEELVHRTFYKEIATWFLAGNHRRQKLIATILKWRWSGVGADIIPDIYRRYLAQALFDGEELWFKKVVGGFIRQLPGQENFSGDVSLLREAGLAYC